MKQKNTLTSGEFAELCGTTKQTLFHYDQMGILKPRRVSGNGYRRYSPEQFFEFDMIVVLQEAGSSLKEIRAYLDDYDAKSFLRLLKDKEERLEEDLRVLARRRESMRHILDVTESALSAEYGKLTVVEEPEERLAVTGTDQDEPVRGYALASRMSEHIRYCDRMGVTTISPVGGLIPFERLMAGNFAESHIFSVTEKDVDPERRRVKPRGLYAVLLYRGEYDRLITELPEILGQIAETGHRPSGDAYICSLMSYLTSAREADDVHKLAVAVQ